MSEANPQNTDCRKARQNLGDRAPVGLKAQPATGADLRRETRVLRRPAAATDVEASALTSNRASNLNFLPENKLR